MAIYSVLNAIIIFLLIILRSCTQQTHPHFKMVFFTEPTWVYINSGIPFIPMMWWPIIFNNNRCCSLWVSCAITDIYLPRDANILPFLHIRRSVRMSIISTICCCVKQAWWYKLTPHLHLCGRTKVRFLRYSSFDKMYFFHVNKLKAGSLYCRFHKVFACNGGTLVTYGRVVEI